MIVKNNNKLQKYHLLVILRLSRVANYLYPRMRWHAGNDNMTLMLLLICILLHNHFYSANSSFGLVVK